MPRVTRPRWSWRSGLGMTVLVLLVTAGGSIAFVKVWAGTDPLAGPRNSRSADAIAQTAEEAGASADGPQAIEGVRRWDDHPRPSRSSFSRRSSKVTWSEGSDGWYLGMGGIALVLAIGGGIAAAARRYVPRTGAGALQVVSRVSLSPKHTVYLLRAGGRVLLVGTGPQGAPALISELDEIPESPAAPSQGEEP